MKFRGCTNQYLNFIWSIFFKFKRKIASSNQMLVMHRFFVSPCTSNWQNKGTWQKLKEDRETSLTKMVCHLSYNLKQPMKSLLLFLNIFFMFFRYHRSCYRSFTTASKRKSTAQVNPASASIERMKSSLVLRLRKFHTLMAFLGALGKYKLYILYYNLSIV